MTVAYRVARVFDGVTTSSSGPQLVVVDGGVVVDVTMTGGHVHSIGREADGVDDVRRAVRAELEGGAECIKLMASGGVLGPPGESPGAVQLTAPELAVAVDEAHRAGRTVAAHAHSAESIVNALDAGVDSVEHGSGLDGPAAQRMAENGVYLVPTLSPLRSICRHGAALGYADEGARKCGR
jgi:imidazolonepropionase-like amidohydrolase